VSKPQLFTFIFAVLLHFCSCSVFRVRSTWDGVRGPHNFWGALVAQQPLPSLVLKLLLELTTVQTVRLYGIVYYHTIRDHGLYGSKSCCISQCPVHYTVKFDADIFIQSGVIDIFPKFKLAAAAIWYCQVV